MKDLIAKLQMDANCALGAIWLHIDAQAARIAELEAQIAAKADTDIPEALELLAAVFDAWENGDDCYEDPEECAGFLGKAFRLDDDIFNRCVELLNRRNPPRNAASTALQAPVREVPGWKMVPIEPTPEIVKAMAESQAVDDEDEFPSLYDLIDFSGENKTQAAIKAAYRAMISASPLPTMPVRDAWRPIETAPKDGTCILVCRAWDADGKPMGNSHRLFTHRAAWWADKNGGNGEWIVYNSMVKDPECFFTPTHWMPVPDIEVSPLPAAPVQEPKP